MPKEFTYKVKMEAEVSQLEASLKTAKEALKSVLDSGQTPDIQKVIDKLENKINDLKTKINTPIKSENAFTGIQKDIAGITTGIGSLGDKVDELKNKTANDKISLLPADQQKALRDAVGAMDTYANAIAEATKKTKDLAKAKADVAKAEAAVQTASSKVDVKKEARDQAEAEKDRAKAIQDTIEKRKNDVQTFKDELKMAEKAADAWSKANSGKKLDTRTTFKQDGKSYNISKAKAKVTKAESSLPSPEESQKAADEYKKAVAAYNSANEQLGRAEQSQKTANLTLEATKEKASEVQAAFDKLKLDNTKAAFDDLKKKASELGISLDGIGDGSQEDIANLTQRYNEFVENGVKPVDSNLGNVQEALKNTGEAANQCAEAATNNATAFRTENEAAGQVDGFISRIKQFTGLAGAAMLARRAISSAFQTIKELDAQMTEMAVVTDLGVNDYWNQLPQHTEAANKLGVAIKDVYEAETLYYQQGLKTAEVEQLATSTLKMARIAGLSAEDATNKMTAALRGFNMEINQTNADRIADVYSNLAAITASNVQEISSAMTKTASLASSAGMEFETTAAFLSQIIETTRESAETAGTALKTVIARFQELKKDPSEIGEVDGEIVDANKIETALRSVGVSLRDAQGQFRDLDDVFMELSSKWDSLDTNTQRYIATIAAGSRQQSRFIAMMQDYGRTQELVSAANNSAGASNEQFQKTVDSLESKLAKLKNAWDTFTMGLSNNEFIKLGIDLLTGFLDIVNKLTKGWDSWSGSALKIGTVVTALIAGDKALKAFTTTFSKTNSVMSAFGAGLKAPIVGLKNFGKSLLNNMKLLKTGRTITTQSTQAINNRKAAQQKANVINKQAQIEEEKLSLIKKSGAASSQQLTQQEEKLRLAKQHQAKANEELSTTQAQENVVLGLSIPQQAVYNAMIAKGVKEEDAALLAKVGLTSANWANTVSVYGETAATHAAELAEKMRGKGLIKQLIIKYNDILATNMQAVTNGTYTGSIWGEIAAKIALKVTNWALFASMPPLLAITLAIVAAVLVLVVAIVGIIHVVKKLKAESPEGKLEAANKALESASESANAAAEAYTNLKDSLSSLNDKYDALDEMTVGTQEWRDALMEVNQEVMDLIDQYPELADGVEIDANGVMRLSDEKQKLVIQQQAAVLAQANNAKLQATIEKNKAEDNVEYSKLGTARVGDTTLVQTPDGAYQAYIANQENTDALARQLASGMEVRNSDGSLNTDAIEEYLDTLGMASSDIEIFLSNLNESNLDALKEYGKSLIETTKAEEAAMKTMMQNAVALVDTNKYTAEQLQQMANMGTDTLNSLIEAQKKATDSKATSDSTKDGLSTDSAYKEYWEKQNPGSDVSVDRTGKVTITGSDGQQKEITAENARSQYATAQATEEMAKKMELLPKALANAGNGVTGLNSAINKAFNDDTGMGLNQADAELLKNQDYLKQMYKDNAEFASIYGSEAEFLKVINERTEAVNKAFEENTKTLQEMGLGDLTIDKSITAEAQKGLIEHLEQVVNVSGTDAAKKLGNSINDLLSNVAAADRDKLAAQLNAIDWNDAGALEDLPDTLKSIGISIPSDQMDEFIQQAKDAAHAIHKIDLASLNEQLTDLVKLRADILSGEQGKSFSQESYESLIKLDPELKKYFSKDLDGNWQYIGSSMDRLVTALDNNTKATVEEGIKLVQNKIDAADLFNKQLTFTSNGQVKEFSAKNIGTDKADQQEFLKTYVALAKANGTNLDGIAENLSTDLSNDRINELSAKELQVIISALAGIEDNQTSLYDELFTEGVQAETTVALANDIQANIDSLGTKKTGTEEAGTRNAIITQAQSAGVSDLDLVELKDINQQMLKLESEGRTNESIYKKLTTQFTNMVKTVGNKAAYNNMLTKVKENVDKNKELIDTYKNAVSENEKLSIASQMASEYGIKATENNYQAIVSSFNKMLNGEREGYDELLRMQMNAQGIQVNENNKVWTELTKNSEIAMSDVSKEYESFIQHLIKTNQGYIEYTKDADGKIVETFKLACDEMLTYAESSVEFWENPYDWLYQLNKGINAEIKRREQAEKAYNVALKQNIADTQTLKDLQASNLKSINTQIDRTKDRFTAAQKAAQTMLDGGKDLGYVDENGNIDYKNNEKLTGEEGEAYAKWLDQYDSYLDEMTDAQDVLYDLYDELLEERNRGKSEYTDLVNRVKDALVSERQAEIDKLDEINSSIQSSQEKLIEKMQEKIDDDRQARDNEKAEQNIQDKQARLAYLQASGGNQTDILALQEEIANDQQSYQDTLVDQSLQELQDANQKAADQRQEQIDLQYAQLDWWTKNAATAYAEAYVKANVGTPEMKSLLKGAETTGMISTELADWEKNLAASETAATIWRDKVNNNGLESYNTALDKLKTTLSTNQEILNKTYDAASANADKITATQLAVDAANATLAEVKSTLNKIAEDKYAKEKRAEIDNALTGLISTEAKYTVAGDDESDDVKNARAEFNTASAAIERIRSGDINDGEKVKDVVASYNSSYGKLKDAVSLDEAGKKTSAKAKLVTPNQDYLKEGALNGNTEVKKVQEAYNQAAAAISTDKLDSLSVEQVEAGVKAANNAAKQLASVYKQVDADLEEQNIQRNYNTAISDLLAYINSHQDSGMFSNMQKKYYNTEAGKKNRRAEWDELFNTEMPDLGVTYSSAINKAGGLTKEDYLRLQNAVGTKDSFWGDWKSIRPLWNKYTDVSIMHRFITGGLADYTGPAWLDGTPSAPELVLNQTDTANFIELKNILADIMRGAQERHTDNSTDKSNGDNYYNIDVSVDSLDSDYDVDQVVERVKELIVNDANYRNVNAVEQIR